MNILVLTPDRVGSSLLQKFITVSMQGYNYGAPVINLHELTNGLERYFSNIYNQDVLGKPEKHRWGYYQNLQEIVSLLSSTDHYKVSRLAQYHLLNRKDSLADQLSFYNYINDNFYIISARRENLFEYALSWCIVSFSKHLNLYTHEEKIDIFKKLHRKQITVNQEIFENYLDKYLNYISWVDDHFRINSIFNYEKDTENLEGYVNSLDIFPENQPIKSWKDQHGIPWNTWNKYHYLLSDMSGLSKRIANEKQIYLLNSVNNDNLPLNSMNLNSLIARDNLSYEHQDFLKENTNNYVDLYAKMAQLVSDRVLIDGIPIKLQTLAEKAMLVKNFKECVITYNNWSNKHNRNHQITIDSLNDQAFKEYERWYNAS